MLCPKLSDDLECTGLRDCPFTPFIPFIPFMPTRRTGILLESQTQSHSSNVWALVPSIMLLAVTETLTR